MKPAYFFFASFAIMSCLRGEDIGPSFQKFARTCDIDLDCGWCNVCVDGLCVSPAACVYVPQCGSGSCSFDAECNEPAAACSAEGNCSFVSPMPRMVCAGATKFGGGRCVIAPDDGSTCVEVLDPP